MKSIVFQLSLCKRRFLMLAVIANLSTVLCVVKCEMLTCLKILLEILDRKIVRNVKFLKIVTQS